MKKLALLSVVLLIASAVAQNKTDSGCATMSPDKLAKLQGTVPAKTGTWKVTNDGAFTVQYDTTIWKEVTDPDTEGNDAFSKTLLVPADGTAFVAIRGSIGSNPDRTYKDTTEQYVDEIKKERSDMLLGIAGETVDGDDKGVFIAYIQEPPDSKHTAFVINDWIFPGDKNDVNSRSGLLIEGLYPATEVDSPWNDRMEAVVKTLKRNAVPKAK